MDDTRDDPTTNIAAALADRGPLDYSAAHATPVSPATPAGELPLALPPATATDRVRSTIGRFGERVGRAAASRTTDAIQKTGRSLEQAAHRLGPDEEGIRGKAASALATGGGYLASASPDEMRRDLEGSIRQRPLAALAVGIGIGVVLGMIGRRRP